ncbi:XVIPCD domain-containing protein [Xanthomonas graminis]|uniref:XVIPCD domain-containing protein n=1 Tax=Xanthomonas graminis TaxID=3390026 RepID=UPI000A8B4102|nr:XVIPCD domain-containing protein [Xanthomonas translucens]
MSEPRPHYSVTIYLAAPGTPLMRSGGTSAAGHMYYSISDGKHVESYGFAPLEHGSSRGLGRVSDTDVRDYKDPYYSRTLEVSREQYEKLRDFGEAPQQHGFDMQYSGATNSCIDFTWGALNHAGLHRTSTLGVVDKNFEGELKPLKNEHSIKSIPAPMPGSDLNKEHYNPKPEQTWFQKAISEVRSPGEQALPGEAAAASEKAQDPLHAQAQAAVLKLEQGLGRDYDANSAKLAASAACLAKENGLSRIDHVVLSEDSRKVRAGENLIVVQGALNDPAHLRAHMRTEDALSKPVDQSLAQLQSLNEAQRQTKDVEQPDQVQAKPHRIG